METWATVTLVLGSNIIIVVATFFTTRYQVTHSDRWREVRGEPLLKLRVGLAMMATKLNLLILAAQNQNDSSDNKPGVSELPSDLDDWKKYGTSEDFLQIVYLQYDAELLKLVENVRFDYLLAFEYALEYWQLKPDERKTFREQLQKTKTEILEVQKLINKKLKEL